MTLKEIQDGIVEEFLIFNDWLEKYEYLIELGKSLPQIDDKFKSNEYLIKGCQSRVWLHAELNKGVINFTADSDAIITKGIVALLVRVLSGQKPEEIIDCDLYFIDKIGLKENLTPTRSNGMLSMIKQMKIYALAYKTQQEKK